MKGMKNLLKKLGGAAATAIALSVFSLSGVTYSYAAEGIDMSTDYPGIMAKAGDSVSFELDFSSLTGDSYDVDLSVESIPEGWTGNFNGSDGEITRVHVDRTAAASDTSLVTFSLSVPEDAQVGTYEVELLADAGGDYSDALTLEVTLTEQENGQGNFSAEYDSQEGSTGTSFSFDTTLNNNRSSEQSYNLSADAPDGWQVSFNASDDSTQIASVTVDSGSSQSMTVNITPPENVEMGEYTIPVTAVSASETLELDLTVEITGTYDVTLSTPTGNLSLDAYANAEKSVTLQVTNNGNVALQNLTFSSDLPTDWEVSFDQSEIETLEAGQSVEVTAYITPDQDAITGDYIATLSISNDEVSSEAQFRVSVKTRTVWGIFAVVIIVALVGVLGFVIKKYGRR
ncbi:putative membrane protein [Catenibacillus scindens]|uniref:Putative membrane protein n=1 Tax=Catenibacillus scindens TaxID=673271 RepID=A0A7W8HAW5_9FIRM|nr:NEW3 domain-containing protein [Catenibacillus scindens]MBB5264327.1 putative membrane protein [Catenibacillus scindens]